MKNFLRLDILYLKTNSLILFKEFIDFLNNYEKIYYEENLPPYSLGTSCEWIKYTGKIDFNLSSEVLFIFTNKRNKELFKNKVSMKNVILKEFEIKYLLPKGPLSGRFFLVLRPLPDSFIFSYKLENFGAKTLPFPVMKIKVVENRDIDEVKRHGWDYVVFTSKRGVRALREILKEDFFPFLVDKKIIAIGPSTAKEIKYFGFNSLIPIEFSQEGLIELFKKYKKGKVLILRTEGRKKFTEFLLNSGFYVKELKIYDMIKEDRKKLEKFRHYFRYITDVIFTSPKIFDYFYDFFEDDKKFRSFLKNRRIICIGSITASHLKKYDVKPHIIPDEFTADSLLKSILLSEQ